MPEFERYIGLIIPARQRPPPVSRACACLRRIGCRRRAQCRHRSARASIGRAKASAEWLVTELSGPKPVLAGIDDAFSFPLRYFARPGRRARSCDWGDGERNKLEIDVGAGNNESALEFRSSAGSRDS